MILSTFLDNLLGVTLQSVLVTIRTVLVTLQSNQMDTNTVPILTKTLRKVALTKL